MNNYPPRFKEKKFMQFLKRPDLFLYGQLEKYPKIFHFKPLFREVYLVHDPLLVKQVLQEDSKSYRKSKAFQTLEILLGKGLLTSEGEFWKRQRRLAQPAFHKKRLGIISQITVDACQKAVERLKTGNLENPVNISREFATVTIDIVSKALFGANVSDKINLVWKELYYIQQRGINRIRNPFSLPLWVPTPANQKLKRSMKMINDVIYDIISQRKSSDTQHDDLLAMLMEAEDEVTGEKMSEQQLRDEVITIFLAGHETTVNAMSWAILMLEQNPKAKAKVIEEVKDLDINNLGMHSLQSLPYLRNVIQETMRLYPPAYVIPREALVDTQLGDYIVPKGLNVLLNVYALHRHPDHWADALKFIPERFDEMDLKGGNKFLFFPFGGGPRMCIGNNFAMMEMMLILALMYRQLNWKLADSSKETAEEFLITLKPKPGVSLHFFS